ncbi:ComF family protein [Clostridium grantii]|uniref:Competence protein ComFC n=1 Tax=Clostridium grantii DSM 8605 TaxID=1121316 RepID=A0A1M5TI47_9CLOT|nr:ComF family protein [Clostridium grantii]SHH50340.1 competence protein ComFC [Clostridium grantii DSM 8605]
MGKKIFRSAKFILECVLDVIYAKDDICPGCDESIIDNQQLCSNCISKIKVCNEIMLLEKEIEKTICYTFSYYSGIIKKLILNLKYKSDFKSGNILAELLHNYVVKNNLQFDCITFVPSSKKALKKRGYNQSEFLAKKIGARCNVKTIKTMYKICETKDQIGLNKEQRWENLKNSFRIRNNIDLTGKIILLVDDVITTGATSFLCCEQLIQSNAKQVIVLSVAKGRI